MSILAAYAVAHPPLIIPAVGRGDERGVADTVFSFEEISRRIAAHDPDTIVISSPHAPAYRDGFFVSNTPEEHGSMAQFRAPQESLSVRIDTAFAQNVIEQLAETNIPCAQAPRGHEEIDHATFIPLYFLTRAMDLSRVRVVRIGLSGLSDEDHFRVGQAVAQAARNLNRRCVFIASGDMSHKLKESGPYGFAEQGPLFDAAVTDIFSRGALRELFSLDASLCEAAAECGLRSYMIMSGALEGTDYTSELLSYEGPFGVGYGMAAFEVKGASSHPETVDPVVAFARRAVEHAVYTGSPLPVPADAPTQLTEWRAGAFVSLHENGDLRGCIGTIAPAYGNLAEEIAANGASAALRDPRFPSVQKNELDYLSYSVDVLEEAQPVESIDDLDPKRFGVIVSCGRRRGVLLPDLEGVDTVDEQLAIARRKAGIRPGEPVNIERFEVVRHDVGGEARLKTSDSRTTR